MWVCSTYHGLLPLKTDSSAVLGTSRAAWASRVILGCGQHPSANHRPRGGHPLFPAPLTARAQVNPELCSVSTDRLFWTRHTTGTVPRVILVSGFFPTLGEISRLVRVAHISTSFLPTAGRSSSAGLMLPGGVHSSRTVACRGGHRDGRPLPGL